MSIATKTLCEYIDERGLSWSLFVRSDYITAGMTNLVALGGPPEGAQGRFRPSKFAAHQWWQSATQVATGTAPNQVFRYLRRRVPFAPGQANSPVPDKTPSTAAVDGLMWVARGYVSEKVIG